MQVAAWIAALHSAGSAKIVTALAGGFDVGVHALKKLTQSANCAQVVATFGLRPDSALPRVLVSAVEPRAGASRPVTGEERKD